VMVAADPLRIRLIRGRPRTTALALVKLLMLAQGTASRRQCAFNPCVEPRAAFPAFP